MKEILNMKRFAALIALLLATVLTFSACGGAEDTSSEPSTDAAVSNTVDEQTASEESDVAEQTESTGSKADKASSKKQEGGTTTTAKKTVWDKDYLNTIPKSVKEKGITILLWRDLHKTEQKLLDDFSKKTGCKVKKVITTELEYTTKLVSMIAAKESPDVLALGTNNFPGLVVKGLQPLDEKIFRLKDDCWNYSYMKAYQINGKYYSVAMPGSWSCEDTLYVTYYQPKVLKECGISEKEMPYNQWKEGSWDWASQKEIAQKVKAAGKGYIGLSLQTHDVMMLSAGVDFVKYSNGKFTNVLGSVAGNSLLTKSWSEVATLVGENALTQWDLSSVQQGKVGLFSAIAYGMYSEGTWEFNNLPGGANSMEAVPVAGPTQSTAYVPARYKTWGVGRGAKNPEGAAYFLRYWLDTANYDTSSTFVNKQFQKVFEYVTKPSTKKQLRLGAGVTNYVTSNTYEKILGEVAKTTPANITTTLNSMKGRVDAGVNKANKELVRLR